MNSRNGNGGTGEKPGHPVERIAHELYAYAYPLVLMDVTGRSWALQKGLRALSRPVYQFVHIGTTERGYAVLLAVSERHHRATDDGRLHLPGAGGHLFHP
jgi:hypothetical protein